MCSLLRELSSELLAFCFWQDKIRGSGLRTKVKGRSICNGRIQFFSIAPGELVKTELKARQEFLSFPCNLCDLLPVMTL